MTLTMYDAASDTTFPTEPDAVAGYTDGRFVSAPALFARYPNAHHLPITVTASLWVGAVGGRLCLDIENSDATPDQAGPWVAAALRLGIDKPWCYFSTSSHDAVVGSCRTWGVLQVVSLWGAQWDGNPALMPGYAAKQYQSFPSYDISSVDPNAFVTPPPVRPKGGDAEMFACTTVTGKAYVVSDSFIMATDDRGVEKFVSTGMPFCDGLADQTIVSLTEGGKRPILNQ